MPVERYLYNLMELIIMEVDARGFSCPIPVVKTQKAMEDNPEAELTVLVETQVSRENVTRLAENKGYKVKVEKVGDEFRLILRPS